MTDAPSSANAFAMLAPMPLDAPVTTATLPSSFLLMSFAPQPFSPLSSRMRPGAAEIRSVYRVGSRIEPGVEQPGQGRHDDRNRGRDGGVDEETQPPRRKRECQDDHLGEETTHLSSANCHSGEDL